MDWSIIYLYYLRHRCYSSAKKFGTKCLGDAGNVDWYDGVVGLLDNKGLQSYTRSDSKEKIMNVYIHIPFCREKCAYCAFLSVTDTSLVEKYFESLLLEIENKKANLKNIETIYFGGGTPSLADPKYLKVILTEINRRSVLKDVEVTLECNPEDISEGTLLSWRKAGVNRLSIGVQTLNDTVRDKIGRRLSSAEIFEKIALAKKYFENVGVDLIAGLPDDSVEKMVVPMEKLASLGIKHLSLYDLEISEGSYLSAHLNDFGLLDEDERETFLLRLWEKIESLGFEQYEISNFAKEKKYSKHNLDFWHGKDYLGLGLGAVSKIKNKIITNTSDFDCYFKNKFIDSVEIITKDDKAKLILTNRIRLNESLADILLVDDRTESLIEDGMLTPELLVTTKGRLYNNYLLKELL